MRFIKWGLVLVGGLLAAACSGGGSGGGGGGGGGGGNPQSYTVGGTVSGLSGTGLVLKDNGGDSLNVPANGTFSFVVELVPGTAYAVTVGTQPAGQTCTVSNGSGTVSGANITAVTVNCVMNTYTVGGAVSGLSGAGLVLKDNGGDNLNVSSSGSFTFATALTNGTTYVVTVGTQPANQTCTVSNGSGTVAGANINGVAVICAVNMYTVGGTVSGLSGAGLVLKNNGGDSLNVSASGGFSFATALTNSMAYAVTVGAQPAYQTCTVSNGSGTVSGANVTNVAVSCTTNQYTIGGSVGGLSGSLILKDNGGDNLILAANGNFAFATTLQNGAGYSVTVGVQPTNQTCTVANGSGTVSGANVTNVAVTCTANHYSIGGSVSGLSGGGLVLKDNGGDSLVVAANGNFTFATALLSGAGYSVTVGTQPTNQTCTVANGGGTVSGANVTNVAVNCTANTYTIGGTVSGLNGAGLVLKNNGADSLNISASGNFTFATALNNGAAYSVSVGTQPAYQTCTVSNGSGTVSAANVTNVAVSCTDNHYTIGGSASGVTAAGLVLQDNGGDSLNVPANGNFTFATGLVNGAAYAVTVSAQPTDETCNVSNGSGHVSGANVTNVSVSCSSTPHKVGGTVSGLSGSGFVLQDNGGDNLNVAANGSFTFATTLTVGQAYAVTVLAQPSTPAQYCRVTNGSGTVGHADVTSVSITCRTTGQNLYVTTTNGASTGAVSLFAIDPATGLLNRESVYTTTGVSPLGIALDANGYGYVAYEDSISIETILAGGTVPISHYSYVHNAANTSTFTLAVDSAAGYLFAGGSASGQIGCDTGLAGVLFNYSYSAGVLTPLASGPYALDANPCGLAMDPTGKLLYAPLTTAGEIVVFAINADGSLTELNGGAPYTFQGGMGVNSPYAVAIHPTAGYLFFTDKTAGTVTVYSYDSGTGAITEVGSPYPVGTKPESVTVDPTGQFLYVANRYDGTVSAFTIDTATGALTAISGSPFATGQGRSLTPTAVAVEPSGQYLYVANGDAMTVSIFSIDPSTGALTAVGAAPSCPNGATCTVGGLGGSGGASALAIQ
jgi:6-phosphogluconolactonase (cycloisomerase 2 family)